MLEYIKNFKGRMVLIHENLLIELINTGKLVTVRAESKETSHKIEYKIDESKNLKLLYCTEYLDKIYLPNNGVRYSPEYNSFENNGPRIETKVLSDLSSMLTIMGVR
jgi:hypothetical protein